MKSYHSFKPSQPSISPGPDIRVALMQAINRGLVSEAEQLTSMDLWGDEEIISVMPLFGPVRVHRLAWWDRAKLHQIKRTLLTVLNMKDGYAAVYRARMAAQFVRDGDLRQ